MSLGTLDGDLIAYRHGKQIEYSDRARRFQMRLRERSWRLVADGYFGLQSEQITKLFQRQHNLAVDGVVGPITWAAAFNSDEPAEHRRTNALGLQLVKEFEGFRHYAYQCSAEVWTIGFGHTKGVRQGMYVSLENAEAFLQEDLSEAEQAVESAVTVPITDNQFAALVAFTFNVGAGTDGFRGSTLLKKLNEGDEKGAAAEFIRWNTVEGRPVAGLTRRRVAERALFLRKGDGDE